MASDYIIQVSIKIDSVNKKSRNQVYRKYDTPVDCLSGKEVTIRYISFIHSIIHFTDCISMRINIDIVSYWE